MVTLHRCRLRALLEAENAEYIKEIGASAETELDRQVGSVLMGDKCSFIYFILIVVKARMRDRAKHLREQREQERAAIAEAKYQQQWMMNSEELRTMRSKQDHQLIADDRIIQVREKEAIKQQQQYSMAECLIALAAANNIIA